MWRKECKEYEFTEIEKIIKFTGDHELYGDAMYNVSNTWIISCENFLSNKSINRRAYLGHAACCFSYGWPEYLVRRAWWNLSEKQRKLADNKAEIAIKQWELKQKSKNTLTIGKYGATPMAYQMKLQMK